jgi:hypothetical protein
MVNLKPRYVILNDRVMLSGSGFSVHNFQEARTKKATQFVLIHGVKRASVLNPFYGDLEISRIAHCSDTVTTAGSER